VLVTQGPDSADSGVTTRRQLSGYTGRAADVVMQPMTLNRRAWLRTSAVQIVR